MFGVHAPQGQYEFAKEIGAEYCRVVQKWGVGISNLKRIAQDADVSGRKTILTLTSHDSPKSQIWLGQIARGLPTVKYFQIENEVLRQWQTGTTQEYATHLKHSYETIKSARPDAVVICGAYTGGVGSSPREVMGKSAYTRILRDAPFDLVDFHCYSDNWQEMMYRADWLRTAMKQVAHSVPLVSLEAAGPWTTYSEARHATDVAQRLIGAIGAGLFIACWSSLVPTAGWGIQFERLALVAANGRRLPAYWTYRLVSEMMTGRKIEKLPIQAGFTSYGDSKCQCIWSNSGYPKMLYLSNVPYSKAKVTTIITRREESMPSEYTVPVENGILKLQIDLPVFIEPIL